MKKIDYKTNPATSCFKYAFGLVLGISMIAISAHAVASEGLKLPEDIEARKAETEAREKNIRIEESRIAGKLERVTVRRKNGIDEVYENKNVDSMWLSEENELGDMPNVRRWTIGSW